jgi:Glycosyl hydrolases family 16
VSRNKTAAKARPEVSDDFNGSLLTSNWHRLSPGSGVIQVLDSKLRLELPGAQHGRYSNAQIDDYGRPLTAHFLWRPPLRLHLRARSSLPTYPVSLPVTATDAGADQRYLRGTAGFGFWNTLLTLGGGVPRLPEAIWFFAASPPSNMALVPGSAGWGWKAQVVHAHRWDALPIGIPTVATIAWARLSGHGLSTAARWLQRFCGAHEAHLTTSLQDWHDYLVEWQVDHVRFLVDDAVVLQVSNPPPGPLGFVAWIDNQYAIATPQGLLRFGTLTSSAVWLEIDWLRITPL